MAERPNALALKASVPNRTGGSNPSVSADQALVHLTRADVFINWSLRGEMRVFPHHEGRVKDELPATDVWGIPASRFLSVRGCVDPPTRRCGKWRR